MSRFRWALVLPGVLLLIVFLGSGCGQGAQKKPAPPPTKIAVSFSDMTRDGNKTIKKVMEERSKKENLDITFLDAKNDPKEQQKHIDKMVKEKVKAVVIQFVDLNAAPAMVQKLKQKNIKVIALQNLPYNTPVDGYVASDHTRAGELQVRFVREALEVLSKASQGQGGQQGGGQQGGQQQSGGQGQQGGQSGGGGQQGGGKGGQGQQSGGQGGQQQGGTQFTTQVTQAVGPSTAMQLPKTRPLKVLIMQGDKKDRAATETTSANINAVKENPDLKLSRVQSHPKTDPSQATATLAELMAANKQPDVVLANDSKLAMAAVQFLKEAGKEKEVITVGMGANEEASKALVSGDHDGEVDPNPELLGQYALDAAAGLAEEDHWQFDRQIYNGDYNIPAKIVPVRLIGKNNAYLLQERWKDLEKMIKQQQQAGGGGQQGGQGSQGGGEQQQSSGGSSGGQSGQQSGGGQGKKGTTLKITTQEGKVMEVKIDGSIKKIESQEGGQQQGGGSQQGGGQGGGGGQ